MQKKFGKLVYDTETAEVVFKYTNGAFGDPAGYEEILYRTPAGNYFVYGIGGETSAYPVEKMTRVAKDKVEAWLEEHK